MKNKNSSPTSITNYSENYHNPICPRCSSANLSTGAGRKPGQMSLRCNKCKTFVGYQNLEKLQKLRRRKSLTPCLELLEKHGIEGESAVFILGAVGGKS
jgi:transposase-like protein